MNSDFNGKLLILATLKKWGILSEKQISDYSTLSHRRISSALRRLEQDRLVKMVESGRSIRTYRITGSGMDHLDRVKQRNDL